MNQLSHFDDSGASRMVDVGGKQVTRRKAKASARVKMEAATLALIRDKKLRDAVEQFCRQEVQHSQQHHAFNRALKAYGYPKLEEQELQVKKDFQRYDNRSLKFCLAYASGLPDHCHGEIGDMWKWHLFEELEYRNLAFDVYQHLYAHHFGPL